ncbi:MAG: hypothetical protein ACRDUX_26630 [Mycobacterium sp.]
MTLEPDDIEAIAQEVAARLAGRGLGLVTVDQLAAELKVERSWVYTRWRELGGFKLGTGRNAPIRFDLAAVWARLQQAAQPATQPAPRRTRPRRSTPDDVQLLSARGGACQVG